MSSLHFIGIDPGMTGALGVLTGKGEYVTIYDMPLAPGNELDYSAVFYFLKQWDFCVVILEQQHAFSINGCKANFKTGHMYGALKAIIAILDYKHLIVPANRWKKWAGLAKKDKNASREKALSLYPNAPLSRKKDHGRAEALLIVTGKQ